MNQRHDLMTVLMVSVVSMAIFVIALSRVLPGNADSNAGKVMLTSASLSDFGSNQQGGVVVTAEARPSTSSILGDQFVSASEQGQGVFCLQARLQELDQGMFFRSGLRFDSSGISNMATAEGANVQIASSNPAPLLL